MVQKDIDTHGGAPLLELRNIEFTIMQDEIKFKLNILSNANS